jgi:single-stranded DNA-specific DHH superfamily exonuclease
MCSLSGRSKKYDLGEIFKKATKGIGRGGGHAVAAGARIKSEDFDRFKTRVLKLMK